MTVMRKLFGSREHPQHIVPVLPGDMDALRGWLANPSGSLTCGRVTFEAVENGGILVRTWPYRM
jgi:hypothetical protein